MFDVQLPTLDHFAPFQTGLIGMGVRPPPVLR